MAVGGDPVRCLRAGHKPEVENSLLGTELGSRRALTVIDTRAAVQTSDVAGIQRTEGFDDLFLVPEQMRVGGVEQGVERLPMRAGQVAFRGEGGDFGDEGCEAALEGREVLIVGRRRESDGGFWSCEVLHSVDDFAMPGVETPNGLLHHRRRDLLAH